jgi:hypothetical protein
MQRIDSQSCHPAPDLIRKGFKGLSIEPLAQWGVELEKVLVEHVIPELDGAGQPSLKHDSSSNATPVE